MRRSILLAAILPLIISFVAPAAPARAKKPVDPAAIAAMIARGDNFAAHHHYTKALGSYNKADKMSRHNCAVCLLRKVQIEKFVGNFYAALDDAQKAVKEAGADKSLAAEAHLVHAALLGEMSSKPNDKKLAQAVAEVQQALALDPSKSLARFDLGYLMLKQGHDPQGVAELHTYLASNATDANIAKLARELIADPRRAREPIAPEFSFTTLEGARVSLDSLHGQVALLDFWGAWCPPCRASVPTLIALHKKYAAQGVQFVGISSDTNEKTWRTFVAAHHMDWPEYIDLSNSVLSAFAIHEFPTYIVLDRDGMIRFRQAGYGNGTFVDLEAAMNKALKEKPAQSASASSAPKTTTAAPHPAAGKQPGKP